MTWDAAIFALLWIWGCMWFVYTTTKNGKEFTPKEKIFTLMAWPFAWVFAVLIGPWLEDGEQ